MQAGNYIMDDGIRLHIKLDIPFAKQLDQSILETGSGAVQSLVLYQLANANVVNLAFVRSSVRSSFGSSGSRSCLGCLGGTSAAACKCGNGQNHSRRNCCQFCES